MFINTQETVRAAIAHPNVMIASDGVLFKATSPQITITPGKASKLVFLQTPSTATTVAILSPPVEVADGGGEQHGSIFVHRNGGACTSGRC